MCNVLETKKFKGKITELWKKKVANGNGPYDFNKKEVWFLFIF